MNAPKNGRCKPAAPGVSDAPTHGRTRPGGRVFSRRKQGAIRTDHGRRRGFRDTFFPVSVADYLSLARIPLGLVFLLVAGHQRWALAVLAVAAATDVLDGWIARRHGPRGPGESHRGDWLDPLCDKLFAAAVVAGLLLTRPPPLTLIGLFLAREMLQVVAVLTMRMVPSLHRASRDYDFRAHPVGKAATVAQFATAAALVLGHPSAWGAGDHLRRARGGQRDHLHQSDSRPARRRQPAPPRLNPAVNPRRTAVAGRASQPARPRPSSGRDLAHLGLPCPARDLVQPAVAAAAARRSGGRHRPAPAAVGDQHLDHQSVFRPARSGAGRQPTSRLVSPKAVNVPSCRGCAGCICPAPAMHRSIRRRSGPPCWTARARRCRTARACSPSRARNTCWRSCWRKRGCCPRALPTSTARAAGPRQTCARIRACCADRPCCWSGMGNIARRLAELLAPFGLEIIGFRRTPARRRGACPPSRSSELERAPAARRSRHRSAARQRQHQPVSSTPPASR